MGGKCFMTVTSIDHPGEFWHKQTGAQSLLEWKNQEEYPRPDTFLNLK
jgi:hypothetical protein